MNRQKRISRHLRKDSSIEKIKTRKRDSNGTENARNKKKPDETIFQPWSNKIISYLQRDSENKKKYSCILKIKKTENN